MCANSSVRASCGKCGDCETTVSSDCGTPYTTKTIVVPQRVMETRMVDVTTMQPETRECTVTVTKCVPREETRTRKVTKRVPREVMKTQKYTVCVPYTEEVTATLTVCQRVPVTTMRTVTKDMGSYQCVTREVAANPCGGYAKNTGCGGCGSPCGRCAPSGCTRTVQRRVWVPNIVTEQVPCTTYTIQQVEQPYS